MLFQRRSTKVFLAVLISIGIQAVVLHTLGSNPLPAGAFCLSEYYRLSSIEEVISSNVVQTSRRWNSVEISYANTKQVINTQLSQGGPVNYNFLNYHFIVCNGLVGENGQIQSTENWHRQLSITPDQTRHGSENTIHIGLITDGKTTRPTNFQIKRTEALVKSLSKGFGIQYESIYCPWW